ncbi:hypothetical protein [Phycicoccus sp. Root101]|uniref:hypothetical protein n=1 Tax=Phycicoccus sp. Root101 TaxID=1736421 RepID=UPI00070332F2|nr:hypothetical protein [Phycicoccus sp. Root101]KQU65468.1 hypothetical protein ASC58_18560 [Phycicoccus sp. Root101]
MREVRGEEPAEVSPLSPAGQVRQWGDLAHGLTSNDQGRRRGLRMLAGLAVVVLVLGALVLALA